MAIQPLGDRILVERLDEDEQTTSGGIIIPDTAKEKPSEGVVKAVGPGGRGDDGERQPVDMSEGDKVLFGKFAGTEVTYEDTEYLIMREDDILAII
jgi:chaperonin GroES